ncbi:hypothetical protein J31TS4_36720 [Paenibacillus sp. J31TS4]|uniref:sporulation-specific diadenylate cyclase CdaS n=1 Tax=Paenibacillus sp. J31TS4 TaxID=2807195 RepID=UPI001B0ED0BC|nr:sporulation-specific diadenylate cyclase CdaS [Paenibacillus sp. J31TS4]GIP40392.1 hypothetical protein J31TS4_36720 [Paenibacillus sp. J31TS4]
MTTITPCDISPLKTKVKETIAAILDDLEAGSDALDNESTCMLNRFAHIREQFLTLQSLASSFYLNCYLSPYTEIYEQLSASIVHMANRRHGALVVIQRNDPLDELLQPGIGIRAQFTNALLESIFFPGNPLHDGGVLIRGNEIVSAANILPLSRRSTRGQKLGTRHRAALGLSERTDALVVVLSEETGHASFALEGKLYPFLPVHPDKAPTP